MPIGTTEGSSMDDSDYIQRIIFVHSEADKLFKQFGLTDTDPAWTFKLNSNHRRVGVCKHNERRIEFSQHFVENNTEELIRDTLLHEIAHALVGPSHGHGDVWRRKCVEIGARPERTCDSSVKSTAKPNYVIKCVPCIERGRKATWYRFRLKQSMLQARCPHCNNKVTCYRVK